MPKTSPMLTRALTAQDATFDALAAQAAMLGFDEAVLVLSKSTDKDAVKLVRFNTAAARAVVVLGVAESLLVEKIGARLSQPPPSRPLGGKVVR